MMQTNFFFNRLLLNHSNILPTAIILNVSNIGK